MSNEEQVPLFLPYVSIVIPVYNGAGTIRLCLDAMMAQDYPAESMQVIVVDNNSTDNTPEIVCQYPVLLLYERELQGPHAATNTGVREASGEILVFTDSDCVANPDWLRKLVAPFADKNVVATGGRIEAYKPATQIERFLQNDVNLFKNCLKLADSFPVSIVTGNAAYRTAAVQQVGLFNANMYTGSEVDLAWRVQWATGKQVIYVDDAVVYHIFKPTLRRMFRHFRIYGYSEIMLATLYKDRPNYPRPPGKQLIVMARQLRSLGIYSASFVVRLLRSHIRTQEQDYLAIPLLWFVAEGGNLCGKLQALWASRYYTKQFWAKGPKPI